MNVICYLNDVEIEEPEGLASLELSLIRDETYHGIGFEASTGTLQFRGSGRNVLKVAKDEQGIKAHIVFRVDLICEGDTTPETVYEGRINMGTYREICGFDCYIEVQTEEDSCMVKFRSRFDQPVDLDALKTFDKETDVMPLDTMKIDLTLTGVKTDARIEGHVQPGGIDVSGSVAYSSGFLMVQARPQFVEDFISLATADLIGEIPVSTSGPLFDTIMTPVFLNEEVQNCVPEETFAIEGRLKGSYEININPDDITIEAYVLFQLISDDPAALPLPVTTTPLAIDTVIASTAHDLPLTWTGTFDLSYSDPAVTIPFGYRLYAYFHVDLNSEDEDPDALSLDVHWDEETYIEISNVRQCPDTTTEAYLIHETLSRVVDVVTDQCAVVKSEYYGRTDSEPYAYPEDGCGSKRIFTSGLKIRNADNPFFFASPKSLIDGLRCIDNIGFGLEDGDAVPGIKNIRIEPADFFYQEEEILSCDHIPEAFDEIREEMFYSLIKIGYRKWEVQKFNGLHEFNSNRQYRTSFETVNKTLELESELVAGSLAIELTRQQNFAVTGAADTTYDNDIFIICVVGEEGAYTVELVPYVSAINVFAPETMYNFRISPARNMLRWFDYVANGYADPYSALSVLYFASGTGNVVMESEIDDACSSEIVPIAENDDITWAMLYGEEGPDFKWKNETFSFEYPLSLADYSSIKQSPYGYISYQCGEGLFFQGWIKEIKYRPMEGMANFTLIKRY